MELITQTIYVPGQGHIAVGAYAIHRALNDIDERYTFNQNPETGDWCLYVKMPHGDEPHCALGFGPDLARLTPEEVVKQTLANDFKRNLPAIMEHKLRWREQEQARIKAERREDAEQLAEIIEHGTRTDRGALSPVFIPRGVKSVAPTQ